MTRAVLEGVAFGLRDGLDLMIAAGMPAPSQVRASGGGTASPLWRQILADVLQAEIATVSTAEGAAYGAACSRPSGPAGTRPWRTRRRPGHVDGGGLTRAGRVGLCRGARVYRGPVPRPRADLPRGSRAHVSRVSSASSCSVISSGFLPMMIIARTSSLVTSCLSTVPTSLPWT